MDECRRHRAASQCAVVAAWNNRLPHTSALVIGAHRDHFGRQGGLLFAGADDNASGTAVLLEVARVLASAPTLPLHPILFVSFSGEEQGLIGSREYVAHPPIPLNSTMAMINVDHAGTGNGRLTVGVTDLDKQRAQAAGQAAQLEDRIDLFGFFLGETMSHSKKQVCRL
ncbi:MAG: M28 family peptidase [Nitrospiraceae bacterium]